MDSQSVHIPVLLDEVIAWLAPQPGQVLVDGTLGGGGHTQALAECVGTDGLVIALDRDPAAIQSGLSLFGSAPTGTEKHQVPSIRFAQANYCDLPEVLEEIGIPRVNGILLDLGISSDQLADNDRGFSFTSSGPLDLRFDPTAGQPAWRLLERLSAEHLANLIYEYGEERCSRRIARRIVQQRRSDPIRTAAQLAALVRKCVPATKRRNFDPATRTFQALRIAVNDELKSLEIALRRLPACLHPGARLAVISFHSLEDRQVKHAFRDDKRYDVLTKKPIRPSDAEIERNPRSRSSRMRVAQRALD